MSDVYDLDEITASVRRAIERSGIERKVYIARMNRFVRVAGCCSILESLSITSSSAII